MRRLFFALVLCGLCSGCVAWRESETKWADAQEKRIARGPGSEDAVFLHWHHDKYLVDSGIRMSVGILPGLGQSWIDGSVDGVDFVNSLWLIPVGSVFANLVFLAPTISSLFFAPFGDADLTSFGFIGCHRWSAPATREIVRRGPEERVVLRDPDKRWTPASGSERTSLSADGTMRYRVYPGFDVLFATVKKEGKADVMFEDGSGSYRRFSLSKLASEGLVYKDVTVRGKTESEAGK